MTQLILWTVIDQHVVCFSYALKILGTYIPYTGKHAVLPHIVEAAVYCPGIHPYNAISELMFSVINEPRHEKTNIWFSTRSDANRAVQSQKMARGLKL